MFCARAHDHLLFNQYVIGLAKLDDRLLKIIIGLALESALVYRRVPKDLVSLYDEPEIARIGELHDTLIDSLDHLFLIWIPSDY